MEISEKTLLERLAARVPGIAGYREREARRETDRRVRAHLAATLEGAGTDLDALRRALPLEALDAVGRIGRTLDRTIAGLRHAEAGYSGLLDQLKVREAELERIYAFDLSLVDDVGALAAALREAAAGPPPDGTRLVELLRRAEGLDRELALRKSLFDTPGTE